MRAAEGEFRIDILRAKQFELDVLTLNSAKDSFLLVFNARPWGSRQYEWWLGPSPCLGLPGAGGGRGGEKILPSFGHDLNAGSDENLACKQGSRITRLAS